MDPPWGKHQNHTPSSPFINECSIKYTIQLLGYLHDGNPWSNPRTWWIGLRKKMAGKPWKTPCLMGKSMVSGFDFPLINPLLHRKIQSCPLQTPSSAPPLRLRPFLAARRSLLRRASAMGSALGLAGLHLWMKDFQGGINMIDTGMIKV